MAGANYMGGKRRVSNAVRARVKDAVGKAQKNHFGKQRLDILSKGLGKAFTQAARAGRAGGRNAPEISLAHARRVSHEGASDLSRRDEEEPATPSGEYASRASHATSRASRKPLRRSKILSALDISEPLFLRAEMDRIAKIPDLLGLPRIPEPPNSTIINSKRHDHDPSPEISPEFARHVHARHKKRKLSPDSGIESNAEIEGTLSISAVVQARRTSPAFSRRLSSTGRPKKARSGYDTPISTADIDGLRFSDFAYADADFEPMPLDSSPVANRGIHEDSGYAEFVFASEMVEERLHPQDHKPTRYSFYSNSMSSSPLARSHPGTASRMIMLPGTSKVGSLGLRSTYSSSTSQSDRRLPALSLSLLASGATVGHILGTPSHDDVPDIAIRAPEDVDGVTADFSYLTQTTPPAAYPDSMASDSIESILSMSDAVHPTLESASTATTSSVPTYAYDGSSEVEGDASTPSPESSAITGSREEPRVEQTLYDALNGRLFEGADPWDGLNDILDLERCPEPTSDTNEPRPIAITSILDPALNVLWPATLGRRGVGYTPKRVESSPVDCSASSPLQRAAESKSGEVIPKATSDFLLDSQLDPPVGVFEEDQVSQSTNLLQSLADYPAAASTTQSQSKSIDLAEGILNPDIKGPLVSPTNIASQPVHADEPDLDQFVITRSDIPGATVTAKHTDECQSPHIQDVPASSSHADYPPGALSDVHGHEMDETPVIYPGAQIGEQENPSPRVGRVFEGPCLFSDEENEEE
ncbi:hypothetical protein OBBRIDRAFT_883983 [Obba rivulosa]|uniref:Uncharacterized protein n=1 Tax=Obba rivulosa TaxID=1052685 RepID=A0A8E2DTP9_9APHY|nr:hypothetical protein OBBRIDRAFT_883983 [Obba rivulosa]